MLGIVLLFSISLPLIPGWVGDLGGSDVLGKVLWVAALMVELAVIGALAERMRRERSEDRDRDARR